MAARRGSGPRGDSSLAAICALIERGSLDRKSKLESSGRICHVRSEPAATRDLLVSLEALSRWERWLTLLLLLWGYFVWTRGALVCDRS
jgi:hypothetical protein